jgi:hypothetical protein
MTDDKVSLLLFVGLPWNIMCQLWVYYIRYITSYCIHHFWNIPSFKITPLEGTDSGDHTPCSMLIVYADGLRSVNTTLCSLMPKVFHIVDRHQLIRL